MGSNFVWNFKGHLWNFTQNLEPIHHKICILRGVKIWRLMISWSYDILSLSETGPWLCSPCMDKGDYHTDINIICFVTPKSYEICWHKHILSFRYEISMCYDICFKYSNMYLIKTITSETFDLVKPMDICGNKGLRSVTITSWFVSYSAPNHCQPATTFVQTNLSTTDH